MFTIIAVTGPTASGKTVLAIEKALSTDAEIVSFDSRQFYSMMDIGTAKPSEQELAAVPHHFIGHLPMERDYSVGEYEHDALECIAGIRSRGRNVVMVGGSGLYLRAVEQGMDEFPEVPSGVREQVVHLMDEKGMAGMQDMLEKLDPEYYARVDRLNPRRLARALEVCLASGKPYSSFLGNGRKERPFRTERINITVPRDELYRRIERRVDDMMSRGLLAEVESLLPYRECNSMRSVGYQEFLPYFDGQISLEQAVEKVKQNTRNYAKRQITWFSKY